jgi:hypothetical protein
LCPQAILAWAQERYVLATREPMKDLSVRNLMPSLTYTTIAADRAWKMAARLLVLPLVVAGFVFPGTVRAAEHPTKEQVVKFVEEGVEFAKKNGKEAFFKEITTGTSFKRGELYFYAYDYNCVCLAHGLKPALVGKDLSDMTDAKQTKFNQSLRDQAKKGSGWVTFSESDHPQSGAEVRLCREVRRYVLLWIRHLQPGCRLSALR